MYLHNYLQIQSLILQLKTKHSERQTNENR